MRVISGTARGCKLQPVKGMATRPTTDRVKENIFNLLQGNVRGAEVLDLFAGTGQLGIEALSRGAAHCDFVEHAGPAYNILCKNIDSAQVRERAGTHRIEASDFVKRAAGRKYKLIFLDPPYGGKILENALILIERFDILASDGIIVCECAAGDRFSHGFEVLRERHYGATIITLLRHREGGTDGNNEDSDISGEL